MDFKTFYEAIDPYAAVLVAHTKPRYANQNTTEDAAKMLKAYGNDVTKQDVIHVLGKTGLMFRSSSPMALQNIVNNLKKINLQQIDKITKE